MIGFFARIGAASAVAIAIAGCTTMGAGTGESTSGKVSANFQWKEQAATHGTMTANLSDGTNYQGQFFQITQQTRVTDTYPLWTGWAGRYRWNGWNYWGPQDEVLTHYSGKVLANLQGPNGYMRCQFTLASPSSGMDGGGTGQCQLPTGTVIQADFPQG